MKKALTLILFVAFFVTAAIAPVIGQEETATPSIPIAPTIEQEETPMQSAVVYGFRMESDMLFYIEAGFLMEKADFVAGIGWNNSIWLGAHKYFYSNEELAAFSGIELHIAYPKNETIEFHPALPMGFAITTDLTTFVVEALIFPALVGEPVNVKFAVSFLFEL